MVYPRPRGEAPYKLVEPSQDVGLSPPTRGSHPERKAPHEHTGSIPAHAGKPVEGIGAAGQRQVYPRPRGEAVAVVDEIGSVAGLSPPTRGSRLSRARALALRRSIPAHAGKPCPPAGAASRPPVYPRPRGEARTARLSAAFAYGLSPPTRGSRRAPPPGRPTRRSIPAHAGKPFAGPTVRSRNRVYPRPRGEARLYPPSTGPAPGLSPPTRGSHRQHGLVVAPDGSIPAHAGKPVGWPVTPLCNGVYPRPRGEAPDGFQPPPDAHGLSPPTRGSRYRRERLGHLPRSIPAHAGKP